jgi:hypothetical protein
VIARWDGTAWQTLGTGLNEEVIALQVLPTGDLVAAGYFNSAGSVQCMGVARWNGTVCSPLGSGLDWTAHALAILPNGDLVAGGGFTHAGGVAARGVARWNGAAWSAISAGVDGAAAALHLHGSGLLVGGWFHSAGGAVSPYVARFATTCPASVLPLGAGCPSSGGGNSLAVTLPWIGGLWGSEACGLPAAALAMVTWGFATASLPLANFLPTAPAGCTLHVRPDAVDMRVPSGGVLAFAVRLPASTALAGTVFHAQVLPLDTVSLALTATNALTMTVGSF